MKIKTQFIFFILTILSTGSCNTKKIADRGEKRTESEPLEVHSRLEAGYASTILEKYWKLIELNGQQIPSNKNQEREAHFILESDGNKVAGNGGCNSFFATYELLEANRIKFSDIASTRMACVNIDYENDYLKAFGIADSYTVNGDTLILNNTKLAPLAKFARDWANRDRYRNENVKLGIPATGETRVVFMGNSITESWSSFDPGFFAVKSYINRGISGQTTPQMLIRFRPDVIELSPSVVVILAGTNDIAGNSGPATPEMIIDNIISMAELAKTNNIKVVLCSVLPVFEYPWSPGKNPVENIARLNTLIKEYSDLHGLVYLDYYSAMADDLMALKSEYTYDGVHPNEAGYKIMEKLVEEAINRVLSLD